MVRPPRIALVIAAAIVPATAGAEPRKLDLGFTVGGHVFADDVELGSGTMNAPGPESSGVLGARLGVGLARAFTGELELVLIPTRDDVLGDFVGVFGLRTQVRLDFVDLSRGAFSPAGGKLRPFVLAGVGLHALSSTSAQLLDDTDACYQWGVGASYTLDDRYALRFELRHLIVPDRTEDGATSDVELSIGLAIQLGGPGSGRRPIAAGPPPPPPPPPSPPIAMPGRALSELSGIQFETGSADITIGSRPALDRAAEILRQHPNLRIEIAGHTSKEGSDGSNLELSMDRAVEVRKYLVAHGIAEDRLVVTGHGASRPFADNRTEAGRALNRRIELKVLDPEAGKR